MNVLNAVMKQMRSIQNGRGIIAVMNVYRAKLNLSLKDCKKRWID